MADWHDKQREAVMNGVRAVALSKPRKGMRGPRWRILRPWRRWRARHITTLPDMGDDR